MRRKRGTKTNSFGVKGREAHDSTPFYSRKLYGKWELPKSSPEDLVERSAKANPECPPNVKARTGTFLKRRYKEW